MTLTIAGVLGGSSAGYANEVERSPVTAAAPSGLSTAFNVLTAPQVPAPTPVLPEAVATTAPRASFASLSEAVAAQDGASVDEPIRCMAGAIYFESKGEPLAGQLAVAQVILNRSRSGRFAADVCGVVKQRGQFSFVRGGQIPTIDEGRLAYRTAIAVAKVAMAESWDAPAPAALYFNGSRSGHSGGTRVATIGHHAFYR